MTRAAPDVLTIVHVSDMRFRADPVGAAPEWATSRDRHLSTLAVRIGRDALEILERRGGRPDLLVVTGNLTEHGRPSEFDRAQEFLVTITDELGIGRDRVAILAVAARARRGARVPDACAASARGVRP